MLHHVTETISKEPTIEARLMTRIQSPNLADHTPIMGPQAQGHEEKLEVDSAFTVWSCRGRFVSEGRGNRLNLIKPSKKGKCDSDEHRSIILY
jgi:hypothetical protein